MNICKRKNINVRQTFCIRNNYNYHFEHQIWVSLNHNKTKLTRSQSDIRATVWNIKLEKNTENRDEDYSDWIQIFKKV